MDKSINLDMSVSPMPLRAQMEAKLRQAIIGGHFPPGTHLTDKMLSETFQVSRPVVREAVRLLAAEGLIDTIPHRGSFVRTMSADEARRFYDLRSVLEALAAKLFAQNATDEEIAKLVVVNKSINQLGPKSAGAEILDLMHSFYALLISGSGNRHLEKMLHELLNHSLMLRGTSLSVPGRVQKTKQELNALVDTIRRRDSEAAWNASLEHVNAAAAAAIAVLQKREEQGG